MVESREVMKVLDSIDAVEAEHLLTADDLALRLDPFGDHPEAVRQALEQQVPTTPEGMTLAETPMGVIP